MLGTGSAVLRGFGIGVLALSALGFFVALLSAVQERLRELARLRALGGGPVLAFPALGSIDLAVVGIGVLLPIVAAIPPSIAAYRLCPARVLRA